MTPVLELARVLADRTDITVVTNSLRAAGRDGGVAFDLGRGNAAQSFNGKGQRGDIQQQNVFHLAAEHARLDRRANGDNFIGIDALVWFLAKEGANAVLNGRHAGHAAHQNHFVDVAGF